MIRVVTRGEPMVRVLAKRARRAWCPRLFPCPYCGTTTLRVQQFRSKPRRHPDSRACWGYVHDCPEGYVSAGCYDTWDELCFMWNRHARAESRILREERKEGEDE